MPNDERVDKWLWAVRIFKTRTQATDACKKGRVSVGDTGDGVVVKPSRLIKAGDIIHVRKPPIQYTFRVLALAPNRLGAKLLGNLYVYEGAEHKHEAQNPKAIDINLYK